MKAARLSVKAGRGAGKGRPARVMPAYDFRVLFFEHEESWSAQCLEYDIATQAKTLEGLYSEVERVLVSHIVVAEELGQKPFKGLPRAPAKYWSLFKKSRLSVERPDSGQKPGKTPRHRIHSAIRVAERISA